MKEHLQARLLSSNTGLRRMISSLITFFAGAYKTTFGFMEGCPLHDPLVVFWVSHPELFRSKRHRVDVELSGSHTSGETVVDVWNYRQCDDSWGPSGKNCIVAESLEVVISLDVAYHILTSMLGRSLFRDPIRMCSEMREGFSCDQIILASNNRNKSALCSTWGQ